MKEHNNHRLTGWYQVQHFSVLALAVYNLEVYYLFNDLFIYLMNRSMTMTKLDSLLFE